MERFDIRCSQLKTHGANWTPAAAAGTHLKYSKHENLFSSSMTDRVEGEEGSEVAEVADE